MQLFVSRRLGLGTFRPYVACNYLSFYKYAFWVPILENWLKMTIRKNSKMFMPHNLSMHWQNQ